MSAILSVIRQSLLESSLDAIFVTRPENRFYASGFTGSAGSLLITRKKALLFTDFRYTEQAGEQAKGFEIVRTGSEPLDDLKHHLAPGERIGFEADHVTASFFRQLRKTLDNNELVFTEGYLERIRATKTEAEIDKISAAVDLAEDAFAHILGFLRPGLREIEVALEMEFYMRKRGAERLAFDMIVASGKRSSMPHGAASNKIIEKGDFVTMDFGAVVDGYCSDMTRTVVMGKADDKQKHIYEIVLEAHLCALDAMMPGVLCKDVDAVARKVISDAGFGENFGHGLGHGVGVVVHENPRLSPTAKDAVLQSGNVVSNEPGIYIPGWGGVRIEDLIAITAEGHRNLNRSPKTLIEL